MKEKLLQFIKLQDELCDYLDDVLPSSMQGHTYRIEEDEITVTGHYEDTDETFSISTEIITDFHAWKIKEDEKALKSLKEQIKRIASQKAAEKKKREEQYLALKKEFED